MKGCKEDRRRKEQSGRETLKEMRKERKEDLERTTREAKKRERR